MIRLGLLLTLASTIAMQACYADSFISGEDARRQVHLLSHEINWYTSLAEAKKAARAQNRLIFWVHMLGHIDGKT